MLKPKRVRTFADLTFKAASEEESKALGNVPVGYIAGWASTSSVDMAGHIVEPGAFAKSIEARGLTGPRSVKLLLNHSSRQVAGVIKKLEYVDGKLWIEAQLNLEVSYVKDIYAVAKDVGFNFSVGFMIGRYDIEILPSKQEVLKVYEGDLFEVSVVPFPMNEEATVEFLKTFEAGNDEHILSGLLVAKRLAADVETAFEIVREIKSHMAALDKLSADEKAAAEAEEAAALVALAAQTELDEQAALEASQAKTLRDVTLTTKFHLLLAATARMKASA